MTPEDINVEQELTNGVAAQLLDLDESIRAAAELVERGRAAYDSDLIHRLAAEAISNRLGEAVANLDADWRASVPSVPWRSIRDNRNFVVHVYNSIDYARLWNTLAYDVPKLAGLLEPHFERARAVMEMNEKAPGD